MLQFSFAVDDFLSLHIFPSVHSSIICFLKEEVVFSQLTLIKINVSILEFNIVSFQIKKFMIFEKFRGIHFSESAM